MNIIYATVMLLAVVTRFGFAQRPDGCPVEETPIFAVGNVTPAAADQVLQDAGVALSKDALTFALGDPRAYVRSLAALKLSGVGGVSAVTPLLQSWLAEKDSCTKFQIEIGLGSLLTSRAVDAKQRPGGQEWMNPFQPCSESENAPVTLLLRPAASDTSIEALSIRQAGRAATTVLVYARNETEQTLPFLMAPPQRLYSATVLDPAGAPARIAKGREEMYKPLMITSAPVFLPLPPHEEVRVWRWNVNEDFDLSAPGTYRVSLGGRIGFLDATVCSNTADVIVEMPGK